MILFQDCRRCGEWQEYGRILDVRGEWRRENWRGVRIFGTLGRIGVVLRGGFSPRLGSQ